ncbi:Winged helix DNA-binding domain-containing protein [Nocardioides alpinus]|uniref:Winged helix DNA-binding domain-containing protein n=1 Tax=Nocardioides alpinus TaxID=748909 RepID=A0A1I0X5U7_9ACTN|nr:winged helix DNA-binding domain-containing protein [Nocardioides alpinus]PKH44138.1 winged helix DNA-binding domain-containing protein [Nocardioides alpinus]SFA96204.1 Winged helix DNA-binding domain-containing protein [Nocardioides alpinus]
MPHLSDAERRRRIGVRHALAPSHRLGDVAAVTRAMTVLHATEAATVHLAVAARSEGLTPAHVDAALYDDREVVKQLAMRRTLFVFPRELLPAAWGSASARVATAEGRRIAKAVAAAGVAEDGDAWLEAARAATLARLAVGPATTTQLRADVPELAGTTGGTSDKVYDRPTPVAPWVLTHLGLTGAALRGRNAGHWRLNKPSWTLTHDWLDEVPVALDEAEGYADLVRAWLGTFGPGTADDIQWWLGSTKTAVARALADVGAEEVALEDGTTGWVLAGDAEDTAPLEPWAALLPTLDPTVMGWKARAFYLRPDHVAHLFDTNGNAGTTAWWDGRIVGCWVQDPDGGVRLSLLEDVGAEGRAALDREAERLTAWLGGTVIGNVYASRLMKQAKLP